MLIPLQKNKPALFLAPMEGVTDYPMRTLLTELCPFTHCVTEFLRISQSVPPAKIFYRHALELKNNSHTATGVPVIFQLLGGDPEKLARAALIAAELGAPSIDLNFGCPAPTVNRHDGGATILKYPERIYSIVSCVRASLPASVPLSVKMRLGWDDPSTLLKNAMQAEKAGAAWVTVHARTKMQGYQPPVYWKYIGELQKALSIPVVANGDIWTLDDFKRCQEETNCSHFMLGRGALANPYLVQEIAEELGIKRAVLSPLRSYPNTEEWQNLVDRFIAISLPLSRNPNYVISRLKQWFNYVNRRKPLEHFSLVMRSKNLEDFLALRSNKNIFAFLN